MKKYIILVLLVGLMGCHNQYLKDYYVTPQASFTMSVKDSVDILTSVVFTNKGQGQTFSIWTGDASHMYGNQSNTGFTIGSSGFFSYSYREPGVYNVVWVAGSVNAKGELEQSVDSVKLKVVDNQGGLDELWIYKIYRLDEYDPTQNAIFNAKGTCINDSTWMCGIIYEAWRTGTINTIKSKKLELKYQLTSSTASLYWLDKSQNEWRKIRSELDNIFCVMEGKKIAPQRLKVVTASSFVKEYLLYAVVMPKLTSFSINGIEATIKHDVTSYNVYDVEIVLPSGTDLTQLRPDFVFMGDDVDLLSGATYSVKVNGQNQTSGTSVVDFSQGIVEYTLYYQPFESEQISQTSVMRVTVTTE